MSNVIGIGKFAVTLKSFLTVTEVGGLPFTRHPIVEGDIPAILLKAYPFMPLASSQSLKFKILFFFIYALIIIAVMIIVNRKRKKDD